MLKLKTIYQLIVFLSIAGLVLPSFSLAQEQFGVSAPQTAEEAKNIATGILQKLPDAVKIIWKEEALPVLEKMREWIKPLIEPWWNKFLGLWGQEVEKRRPALEQEFQKERQEMQNDLWERFKDLLK